MPVFTIICRLGEPNIILTESMPKTTVNDQWSVWRKKGKKLFSNMSPSMDITGVLKSDEGLYFLYTIENGICYMTLCEKDYPRQLAVGYIDEIKNEFDIQHGQDIKLANRQYFFQNFGMLFTFI
eukprot:TRINITY_DN3430_c0_g2_i1.p1 TRINITY_DN3430_c0_g2~~TRINITY_DN3430_c0_g2_i1.p1  ORF type:complete len:136 (-),score=18.38 TRINITY_DN3430_c0_g2_i1:30-401(-)